MRSWRYRTTQVSLVLLVLVGGLVALVVWRPRYARKIDLLGLLKPTAPAPAGNAGAKRPRLEDWHIELSIPERHIERILEIYETAGTHELDVEILLTNLPTRLFRGKLSREKILVNVRPRENARQGGDEPF